MIDVVNCVNISYMTEQFEQPHQPENQKPYDVEALNVRKTAVLEVLGNPALTSYQGDETLKRLWLNELSDDLQPAIDRNEKKWGHPHTMVISFADAALHYEPDFEFADKFIKAFGAHISLKDEVIDIDPSNQTIIRVLSDEIALPRIQAKHGVGQLLDNVPEGSFVVTDENGSDDYLVVETDIDGVKLVLEGSSIRTPESNWRMIRPMLLVKMADSQFMPLGEEKVIDPRKSWLEIHGREPGPTQKPMDYGQQIANQAILADEVDMAMAASAWVPEAKPGSEILVTPTTLKDNPVLDTDEKRMQYLSAAYLRAFNHFYQANKGEVEPLVGNTMWQFHILSEVLGMYPQEVMKDGEALGTLVEYLEEVARATPGVYGPSCLLPEAKEGNTLAEMLNLIKDTWDFPDMSGFSAPMLSDRVNWNQRKRSSPRNN